MAIPHAPCPWARPADGIGICRSNSLARKVLEMSNTRLLSAVLLCLASSAGAGEPALRGAFAVEAVLQIPNIYSPPWKATRYVCLNPGKRDALLPIPVLSPNNPFAACHAERIVQTDTELRYHIVCPGRGAARAEARYTLSADGFRGYVAMVLGAKNMTLTEIQVGRRLGECAPTTASAPL